MTLVSDRGASGLEHHVFFYDDDRLYADVLGAHLRIALAAGDAVIAVVPPRNERLLRGELGSDADRVTWIDATTWYEHPVRAIADYDATLDRLDPSQRAFVIGEVEFGNTERDWHEWTRYEAAVNHALQHHDAHAVCPYDARRLPPGVLDDARRTHPFVLEAHGRRASEHYTPPEQLFDDLGPATRAPAGPPDLDLAVDSGSVRDGRLAFASFVSSLSFPPDRVEELALAVGEVLSNAVRHGGGGARLRIWRTRDGELTCVVDDDGPGTDDPLLGLRPPAPGSEGGYGLWIARRLFDRSELSRAPGGGLSVLLAARH